jgi:hypothetical protein
MVDKYWVLIQMISQVIVHSMLVSSTLKKCTIWNLSSFYLFSNLNNHNLFVILGRGRFIPTMPFEAQWNAVIDWLDMKDNIDKILPNRMSFPEEMLLKKEELFLDKGRTVNECKDSGEVVSCIALDDEITSVE